MTARILLTCVGGTLAPDLVIHLRSDPRLGARVVGGDGSPTASGRSFVDAFYQIPLGDAPGYVDAIVDIIRRERVNVVLPGSDQEAFALSRSRDRLLDAGARLLTSPSAVLELISSKEATYAAIERAGIPAPVRRIAANPTALEACLKAFGYPDTSVAVKPVAGRGGRGLRILAGRADEIPAWIGGGAREQRFAVRPDAAATAGWFSAGELMVMPILVDPAYDVDVLAVRGKAVHAVVRRRHNPAGIPFAGNSIVPDDRIRDYCLAIAEAIGLDGLHDIDLMTDRAGNPALLEVNPRMSGSVVAAHAGGFPIVSAAVAAALEIEYPIPAVQHEVSVGLIPRAVRTIPPE